MIRSSQKLLPTQRTANKRDKHPCHAFSEIRIRNPSNQASAGLRLRPNGHRDRNRNNGRALNLTLCLSIVNYYIIYPTFIETLQMSVSYAKCRLKSVAITWLRLKLQLVTSLPQFWCPVPPYVALRQAEVARYTWVGVFQILVRAQLVSTELLNGSLQSLPPYTQAVPHTMPCHPL